MSDSIITDIHTHVLPGVDDGPANLEDALLLLAAHKQAGTQRLFCTSHLGSPHFNNTAEDLADAFASLSTKIGQGEYDLGAQMEGTEPATEALLAATAVPESPSHHPVLLQGAELRVNQQLTERLQRSEIPTLGHTTYVLLEYPNSELNERLLDIVHELRIRGFRPIMAHPERSIVMQKDMAWIDRVQEAGLLLQLTAQCLESPPTSRSHMADKLAWTILERGGAAVIASDAHDPLHRPPGLTKAYDTIAVSFGSEVSSALINNANAVWADEQIQAVSVPKRKRGLFRR
jgi:protein-tyrosine phosphatase